jgi:Cytochrome c biogenesis factor
MTKTKKDHELEQSEINLLYEEEFARSGVNEERRSNLEVIDIIGSLMQDKEFLLEDESNFTINKVLSFLNKEINENRSFTEAWLIKGTVLYKIGKFNGAIEAFDGALTTIPIGAFKENPHLWKRRHGTNYKYALKFKALALFKLGRYKEGLNELNDILAVYPDDSEIQEYKNILHILEDQSLITELNELPYNYPKKSGNWKQEKKQAYELDRYQKTLENLDKNLEINPQDSDIWKYRGSTLYILGRYEEALEAFEKSSEINPKNENVWSFKGSTLYMLNKPEKALKAFDKALQKNPNKFEAWFNKGSVLLELGRYTQSLSAVENALRINAKDARALNLKNSILDKLDKNEE